MNLLLVTLCSCLLLSGFFRGAAALPKVSRPKARLMPCDTQDGCPLQLRFAANDPEGDVFVANNVFWVLVRRASDDAAKRKQMRFVNPLEPWIRNLQQRHIFLTSIECAETENEGLCENITPDKIFVFFRANDTERQDHAVSRIDIDDFLAFPKEHIYDSLRSANGMPMQTKMNVADLIQQLGSGRDLLVVNFDTSSQGTFFAIELGGLLRPFGIAATEATPQDLEIRNPQDQAEKDDKSAQLGVFDISSCDLKSLKTCNLLRYVQTQTETEAGGEARTPEEVACDILLTRHATRQIRVSELSTALLRRVVQVCPVVLLVNEDLAAGLPPASIDAALATYGGWNTVALLFNRKTAGEVEEITAMQTSSTAARLLVRGDRWSNVHAHNLQIWSTQAFEDSLTDKTSVYEFLRSKRADMTYLRMEEGEDGLFILKHDLGSMLESKRLGSLNKVRYVADEKFPLAIKQTFVMIHFYQSWNPTCRAVHETVQRVRKIFAAINQSPGLPFTSVNCFKSNQICEEHGVKAYPTLKIFRRGVSEDFNQVITVKSLLTAGLLSIKKKTAKITDEKRWKAVKEDFSPFLDLIFVAVDLTDSSQKSFAEAANERRQSDLLIEATRTALPVPIQDLLPKDQPCIFAYNPHFNTVDHILQGEITKQDVLSFVQSTKLYILSELSIGDIFEIQKLQQPLVIAFVRSLEHDLVKTLLEVSKIFQRRAIVRWMNATALDTIGVMQAYNITHTPSIMLKMNEKIFPFFGPRIDVASLTEWISGVTGDRVPSSFVLKETDHRLITQYLDHVSGIFDTKAKTSEESTSATQEDMVSPATNMRMKDEL